MFKTIQSKLITFICVILVFVLGLIIFFNILFAQDFYISKKEAQIVNAYNDIVEHYDGNLLDLHIKLSNYEDVDNLRVLLLNDKMQRIYDSREIHINEHKFDRELITMEIPEGIFTKDPTPIHLEDAENGTSTLDLYGAFEYNSKKYYVIIEAYVAAIDQSVMIMNQFIIYGMLIALLLGVIFAYVFSKRISNPIKQIDYVAHRVCEMDFTVSADEKYSNDEIGHLAKSINIMSGKIREMIYDLKAVNSELEMDIEEKERIDKMRKELLANVSHELKTPIALLMGYSEMLVAKTEGIDRDYYCQVIFEEAHKMDKIVRTLLNISSIETGLSKLKLKETNISNLVVRLIDKSDILFSEKGILREAKIDPGVILSIDEVMIEQAMNNYIINAIDHTERGNKVTIKLLSDKDTVTFSVYNEGQCIKNKDLDKIWESFYKAEDRNNNGNDNVGLGLHIVKTIIKSHGGIYGVNNKIHGVEFWFTLNK